MFDPNLVLNVRFFRMEGVPHKNTHIPELIIIHLEVSFGSLNSQNVLSDFQIYLKVSCRFIKLCKWIFKLPNLSSNFI
jgi:hypothetical protein